MTDPIGGLGLQVGWRIGTRLTAPVDGTIVGVQILWESASGNGAPALETAIRVSAMDSNGHFPGATLATISFPILQDGVVNEFRFLDPTANLFPLAVPISAGTNFSVDLQLGTAQGEGIDSPGFLIDDDGTQGKNYVRINSAWLPFTDVAIPGGGDIGIRAIIQPVPEPSTSALAAIGVVALLALGRRKLST